MSDYAPPEGEPVTSTAPTVDTTPVAASPVVDVAATPPVEMQQRRNPNDVYAFGAMLCALLGFIIPIIPAAAALMLVRATEAPLTDIPLSPSAQSVASAARTMAYVSLTIMVVLCSMLLLGILGRVLSLVF